MPARRRRRTRRLPVAAAFVVVVVLATGAVVALLNRAEEPPAVQRCSATLEGTDWYLEPDQADTAAVLAGTALDRGLPARALTIALATGLQESKLRNLDHGDRDSVGIFQQRPSQGWGSSEQIMNPWYATNAFYDALVRVEGYQDLPITQAAQAVQRSAFPEAYAQHETRARAWASAMYGYSGPAVTCMLAPPTTAGDPQRLQERAARDLPRVRVVITEAGVVMDAAPLAGSAADIERMGWAVAQWAVLLADPLQVVQVHHATATWHRDTGWEPREAAEPPGTVLVILA